MGFRSIRERRTSGFLTTAVAGLTVLAGISACGSSTADETPKEPAPASDASESPTRPAKGPLYTVMTERADEGMGFSLRDATSLNRYVSPAHAKKFKLCFEKEKPNLKAVILYAVRNSETCPHKVGTEGKAEGTPDVVGTRLRKAIDRLVLTGYQPKHIHVDVNGKAVSEERSWSYEVCKQSPPPGTPFTADLEPRLVISASCLED